MLHALFLRSSARLFLTTCTALTIATASLFAQIPTSADGFDPNVDGNVYAVAVQADGKTIIAGQFANLQPNGALTPTPRNNIARLNLEGTVDASFNPDVDGPIRALLLQPNGQILIGGDFTSVGGVARNRVARINVDGTLDAGFDPNVTGTIDPDVFALALQADGAVVVGGYFSQVQPPGQSAPVARQHLARFTSSGALDENWNPSPSAAVLALAVQADGKLLVGGGFTTLQASGSATKTPRSRLARLNTDGSLDVFDPGADNAVYAFAFQRDGKILIGGSFANVQGASHSRIARLNLDGTVDDGFASGASGTVKAIGVQPDGGILIGGTFANIWSGTGSVVTRGNFARFNPNGTGDFGFAPAFNSEVSAFALQSDGKIVVGGYFTRSAPFGAPTPHVRNHVARVNPNGTLDATFALDPGGRPLAAFVQSDGKIVIGGTFTNVGGATHTALARLNADGSVDSSFNGPPINGPVYAVEGGFADGSLLIGGDFTSVGSASHNRLARIKADGSVDTAFNAMTDGPVTALVAQSDGAVLIGGRFFNVQGAGETTPTARANMARLTAAGAVDTTFNPSANEAVTSIVVQPDGKIVFGGLFTIVQANGGLQNARGHLARVNADGTLDPTFNPNFNDQISAIALQGDGKIIVGGTFTAVIAAQSTTVVDRSRIARFNSDGSLDEGFDPNPNGSVLAIAVDSSNRILIGGTFTSLQPAGDAEATTRHYVARLTPAGKVDADFDLRLERRSGGRVDSFTLAPDGRVLVGGSFASLQPNAAEPRVARASLIRLESSGAFDAGFDLGAVSGAIPAQINALVVQRDDKVVAAGEFEDLGGAKNEDIARFHPEGALDVTFSTDISAEGVINAVAARTNSGTLVSQLLSFAWLNPDGTLRSSFAPTSPAFNGSVNATAIDNQGRVLLGGAFVNIVGERNFRYLTRFNADGTLDTSFYVPLNDWVSHIVVQPDDKIIIAGQFTRVHETARRGLARINADGTLDTTFDPGPNASIFSLRLQPDGKILVGGNFTSFIPNGGTTVTTRNFLARLEANGSIDTTFNPNPNGGVYAIALDSANNKIVIGGEFISVQPGATGTAATRTGIARLNSDGTLDTAFTADANNAVRAITVEPDGDIVFGGEFTTVTSASGTDVIRAFLARVNSTGTVDPEFNPSPNSSVISIVREESGSFVIVGNFGALFPGGGSNAILRDRLARITSSGQVDPVLNPDFVGEVVNVSLAPDGSLLASGNFSGIQPNGLLIVGGAFTNISGVPAERLALLGDDGSVSGVFQPKPNAPVHAILALSDGGFVIGGEFTTVAGQTRERVARFTADNGLEPAFAPSFDGPVHAMAQQSDGKFLVAGSFANVNGLARAGLARLNADGSLDASFIPLNFSAGVIVRAIGVQPDGRIVYVTGSEPAPGTIGFSAFEVGRLNPDGSDDASFTRSMVAEVGAIRAISILADGRILVVGSFPGIGNVGTGPGTPASGPAYLARLNADGTIDPSFNPAPNAAVTAIAPQADGRINIAGQFTRVGGLARVGIARVGQSEEVTDTIGVTADRTTVIWSRSGPTVDLASVRFETSTNQVTWTFLGTGTRMGGTGNWQLTGQSLPATGTFYIRARGVAIASAGKSSGVHEIERQFNYQNPFGTAAGGAVMAGDAVTVDPASGIVQSVPPTAAGVYFPSSGGTSPTILGVSSTAKVLGAGEQVGANIVHSNGNTYDQILLEGAATTVTADPGEIVRVSFADLTNDLVQVEFSGAGSLSVVLDAVSGPEPAAYYNQPAVSYMQGHAAIIIVGANETTNVSVFSVGPLTAVDQSLFRNDVTYDGVADLAYLAISSTDGKFGSIRTGNVNYFATRGLTGIYAPGVHVSDVVNIGDINGFDSAVAMLKLGSAREINVAGGDFWQQNGQPLEQSGVSQLNFVGGMTSHGRLLPAQSNRAPLDDAGSAISVTPEG